MLKAAVYVTMKQNVLDPQGKASQEELKALGYDEVSSVRIGKYIELKLDTNNRAEAEERVKAMCEQLLVNTVVEDYRFELTEE